MADTFSADVEDLEAQPTVCARVTTRKELLGDVLARVSASVFVRTRVVWPIAASR